MLTVGARYTHESKTLAADARFTNTLCPAILNTPLQSLASLACVINGSAPSFARGAPGTEFSEGQWTGTAVLSVKPTEDLMLYASASKGYKAGGFNLDFWRWTAPATPPSMRPALPVWPVRPSPRATAVRKRPTCSLPARRLTPSKWASSTMATGST